MRNIRGSSAMLRPGSSPCKNKRMIKQRQLHLSLIYADMAKLADVQDLGSCAARRVGSTPTIRTIKGLQKRYSHRKTLILSGFFCFYGQNFYFRFVRTKKIFFSDQIRTLASLLYLRSIEQTMLLFLFKKD